MTIFDGIRAWLHRMTAPRNLIAPLRMPGPVPVDPEITRLLGRLSQLADELEAQRDLTEVIAARDAIAAFASQLVDARVSLQRAAEASQALRPEPLLEGDWWRLSTT